MRTAGLVLLVLVAAAACQRPDLHFDEADLPPCADGGAPAPDARPIAPGDFVTRAGSHLWLHGAPFRFAGANIYWLGLDENVDGVAPPSPFRVGDALDTAQLMGATVVRSISLGVSVGCGVCIEPSLGVFNDAAFVPIDHALAAARDRGLRVVIPLVDNYRFFDGGRFVFTDWRGLTSRSCGLTCAEGNRFFTDAQLIADYEAYIAHVLDHVDPQTGLAYHDDPTIMAWETGNEMDGHPTGYSASLLAWTRTISQFIKSRAPHQLVVDGYIESDRTDAALGVDTVDLYTGHYYPMDANAMRAEAARVVGAGKAFFVGEFDWLDLDGGDRLDAFLDAMRASDDVSGDLYWSLFPHLDTSGFEPHADGYTLHFPGDDLDRQVRVRLLQGHAFALQGVTPAPADAAPAAPLVTSVQRTDAGNAVAWRGAAGAAAYSIETSDGGPSGPWQLACDHCATDAAPWTDPAPGASTRWYRVRGFSPCGVPGPTSAAYGFGPRDA